MDSDEKGVYSSYTPTGDRLFTARYYSYLAYKVLRLDADLWTLERWKNPALIACCAHFILISSYFMWWGGWCHGPCHLVPVLALILYLGRSTWCREPFNTWLWFLASAGVLMNWMAKAVGPVYPDSFREPFGEYILPLFATGEFSPWTPARLLDSAWQANLVYLWPIFLVLSITALFYSKQTGRN